MFINLFVGSFQACPGLSNILQNKAPISPGLIDFVYLLHVVTHLWKSQCYHAVFGGYAPACLKLSEITHCQDLWKGLNDNVDFFCI